MDVTVYDDSSGLADGAAATVTEILSTFDGRRATVGLAGGSTPRPVYERLRWMSVAWEGIDLWLSDERWVPPDHYDSNGRMVEEALAAHVPATMLRPRWSENLRPADSAVFYEASLRRVFHQGAPDLVLLGIGEDGHTASLFPGTEALNAPAGRIFVENHVPSLGTWRLTATPALLAAARSVLVLASGSSKADAMRSVLEDGDSDLPASILADAGAVRWLLDADAASRLG
jgi:6-phosphogluconolactonase